MGATGYFTLAALIVVLLPAVVLPWEGRKVPDFLFAAIALAGLVASGLHAGPLALVTSAGSALVCLALVGGGVAMLRMSTGLQILTGGQIKLMAAGATWLGPAGTAIMIIIAAVSLFSLAALQQVRDKQKRPDSAAIVAMAILCVAVQQNMSWL